MDDKGVLKRSIEHRKVVCIPLNLVRLRQSRGRGAVAFYS
ncbi:hypothetical protein SD77_1882 [Bacillus badius]|uniref:Ribose 5-phosphate isomerase B n=1 Tax=Bacillus badius TaxID=1455 RepID=A0ABR5AQ87_BACBA|nr:hypothetical protein SD78_0946 [Bacillus badius]KIL76922.1 hypothetical protein SD77_1882 [Bacillus badius]